MEKIVFNTIFSIYFDNNIFGKNFHFVFCTNMSHDLVNHPFKARSSILYLSNHVNT